MVLTEAEIEELKSYSKETKEAFCDYVISRNICNRAKKCRYYELVGGMSHFYCYHWPGISPLQKFMLENKCGDEKK